VEEFPSFGCKIHNTIPFLGYLKDHKVAITMKKKDLGHHWGFKLAGGHRSVEYEEDA